MYKLRYKQDDAVEVGLDEAGRGPLAGPVVAAAVAVMCHSREGGNLFNIKNWIPAFAGMIG